jgi:hypothetical protein
LGTRTRKRENGASYSEASLRNGKYTKRKNTGEPCIEGGVMMGMLWNDKRPHEKYNLHTIDYTRSPIVKNAEKIERQNKDKAVCLTCKKKKCSGTVLCFERERSKRND